MLHRAFIVFQYPVLILIAMLGIALFPISIIVYIIFGYNIPNEAILKLVEISNEDEGV